MVLHEFDGYFCCSLLREIGVEFGKKRDVVLDMEISMFVYHDLFSFVLEIKLTEVETIQAVLFEGMIGH